MNFLSFAKFTDIAFFSDRNLLLLDIGIFVDGITCEYVKMCRNYTSVTLDELYEFTKIWFRSFVARRAPSI